MADLRAADPFRQGGGRPFAPADRSRFLEALDRALRAAARDGRRRRSRRRAVRPGGEEVAVAVVGERRAAVAIGIQTRGGRPRRAAPRRRTGRAR